MLWPDSRMMGVSNSHLISDPRLREPEIRLALTYAEVFFLERRTFFQVMDRHRLSNPELCRQIRHFTVRLSARRAIITEARWRRSKQLDESVSSGPPFTRLATPPRSLEQLRIQHIQPDKAIGTVAYLP